MTHAFDSTRTITLEQFEAMPESDRYRIELSRGLVVRKPRPGAPHGYSAGRIYALLLDQEKRGEGHAVIESGFLLSSDPPTVRGPDVAFILKSRLPSELPLKWWPFAPDLAVEAVSPANGVSDIQQKVLDYFGAGTSMVWVVDLRTRSVAVHRSLKDAMLLTGADELASSRSPHGPKMPITKGIPCPPGALRRRPAVLPRRSPSCRAA